MRMTNIFEDYAEYSHSRWVHYSDHEMLTIRAKSLRDDPSGIVRTTSFHNDPIGIYFFPEGYRSQTSMWAKMKYKYIVTLKPDARVLDLPRVSDDEVDRMLSAFGATERFYADPDWTRSLEGEKKIKRMWEIMRDQPRIHAKWNKSIRNLGYDAVFDDAGIIHNAEPIQLIVLNPRIINVIDREQPKGHYFEKITNVVAELKAVCEPFGTVTVEGPKLMKIGWLSSSPKTLAARVDVRRSEHNYADFKVSRREEKDFSHLISVSLSWSRPSLNHGVGASFNAAKNEWEYRGLEGIKRDLENIFAETMDDPATGSHEAVS
jgi:hypothetical protein